MSGGGGGAGRVTCAARFADVSRTLLCLHLPGGPHAPPRFCGAVQLLGLHLSPPFCPHTTDSSSMLRLRDRAAGDAKGSSAEPQTEVRPAPDQSVPPHHYTQRHGDCMQSKAFVSQWALYVHS